MPFIVWARVSGGVTGTRSGALRSNGQVLRYDTLEEAESKAAELVKYRAEKTTGYDHPTYEYKAQREQCSARVRTDDWHAKQCEKAATSVAPDGLAYCGQHDPAAVEAKREKRAGKWQKEREASEAAKASAELLAVRLGGRGRPEYASPSPHRMGAYTGGLVLTAKEAEALALIVKSHESCPAVDSEGQA